MKEFLCTFAYDIPHFADFLVKAKNEKHARKIIESALANGKFCRVVGDAYENEENHRVFVSGPATQDDDYIVSMKQLIKESHGEKTLPRRPKHH